MTEQAFEHDDEISLLDILVTLAESWKLLVFGPLIAGVLAGGLSFLWPKTFESQAIFRITEEEAVLLHTATVLDQLIVKFDMLKEAGGVMDDARQDLKKQLLFAADKKTKLVTLTAKGKTPEAAQALATDAIKLLLIELKAKGKERELIEKTIAINEQAINVAEDAVDTIQRSLKRGGLTDQAQESGIKNLAAVISDISKRNQENATLSQKLEVRGLEVFVQEPSLPQKKSMPKLSIVFAASVSISIFIILVFVFVRKAIQTAKQDVEAAKKISIIKSLLGFKSHG